MKLSFIIAAAMLVTFTAGAQAPAASPFVGHWKLNISRSSFPNQPPPGYFNLRQYEQKADGFVAHTMISGTASAANLLFTVARYDGKEYRVYNSATLADFIADGTKPPTTVTFARVDDRTIEYTDRAGGKISSHGPCTISPDGATLTIVSHALDPQGHERAVTTMVYERQSH